MPAWGSILSAGKAVAQSGAANILLEAGAKSAANELFDMDGFTDPQAQSPTAPIAKPKAPDLDEPLKKKLPKWAIPAAVGAAVLLLAVLARKGGKK